MHNFKPGMRVRFKTGVRQRVRCGTVREKGLDFETTSDHLVYVLWDEEGNNEKVGDWYHHLNLTEVNDKYVDRRKAKLESWTAHTPLEQFTKIVRELHKIIMAHREGVKEYANIADRVEDLANQLDQLSFFLDNPNYW